jgi:hypothetical protein
VPATTELLIVPRNPDSSTDATMEASMHTPAGTCTPSSVPETTTAPSATQQSPCRVTSAPMIPPCSTVLSARRR